MTKFKFLFHRQTNKHKQAKSRCTRTSFWGYKRSNDCFPVDVHSSPLSSEFAIPCTECWDPSLQRECCVAVSGTCWNTDMPRGHSCNQIQTPCEKRAVWSAYHHHRKGESWSTCTYNFYTVNIVAAFRGMHVSLAKHSYTWLPRKCDYRTDRHTDGWMDRQTPDKVIPMCRYASQATQKQTGKVCIKQENF